jgi:hypothetical protein
MAARMWGLGNAGTVNSRSPSTEALSFVWNLDHWNGDIRFEFTIHIYVDCSRIMLLCSIASCSNADWVLKAIFQAHVLFSLHLNDANELQWIEYDKQENESVA